MNAVEFAYKAFQFDETLPAKLAELEKEGFVQIPGLSPVVIYMVFRNVAPAQPQPTPQENEQQPAGAGVGVMRIDDSKVTIIRDGKEVPA